MRGFRVPFGRRRRERELDEEIRSHFRMAVEERVARGESREQAERAVRREFGNEARVREVTRTMWGGLWLDRLMQDLRLGIRALVRHPRYFVACASTLALGLAACVTMFSVVDAVILRPLPYADGDRLVMVETHVMSVNEIDGSSVPDVEDWASMSRSLEGLTYFRRPQVSQVTLLGDFPRRLQEGLVGRDFFQVAGVAPVAGRTFSPAEQRGGDRVVVLREDLWEEQFGSVPFVPGHTAILEGDPHSVIGVMPRRFQLPTRDTRLWRPLSTSDWWEAWSTTRQTDGVVGLGRLGPGLSVEEARVDMAAVAARLRETHEVNADKDVRLTPLVEVVGADRDARRGLWLLFASVLLLLALACANVAGLTAARGTFREREMGVRVAIGAGRTTLVRQLVTEASVLALFASVAGVVLAHFAVSAVSVFGPADLPGLERVALSPLALGFALLSGAATVALFAVLPALRASRATPGPALKGGGPESVRSTTFNGFLVAGQVVIATVLLVGGGLLVESFLRATAVDPGYAPDRLVIASVDLRGARYSSDGRLLAYHREARQRLEALPGVAAAGSISGFFEPVGAGTDPLGRRERLYSADGGVVDWPGGRAPSLGGGGGGGITAGYLEALDIPLVAGRTLDERDLELGLRGGGDTEAIVINETMARAIWPGGDPLGRRFQFGTEAFDPERFSYQVVGVVADVRTRGLDEAAGPSFYVSDVSGRMDLVVRTSVDAASSIPSIRSALQELDPVLPVDVRTAGAELAERLSLRRFQSGLIATFAGLALLLAASGVYTLLAYHVATRTREIGIRRALGATESATFALVMRRSGRPVLLGLGVGLALGSVAARALEGLLFDVEPLNVGTYVGTAVLLCVAVLGASYLPATAATKVRPIDAVRLDA